MARKFVVSVLSKVVGVRREARERRRVGFPTRPSAPKWVEAEGLVLGKSEGAVTVAVVVVVGVTAKSGIDDVRFWL